MPHLSAVAVLSVSASEKVQQKCAATASASSDPKRAVKTSDLRQRPPPTSMQLVHTEEVASYRMPAGSPERSCRSPIAALSPHLWSISRRHEHPPFLSTTLWYNSI